ncbi:hypothetical protein QTN25_002131 [Entamoeba marina]
MNTPQNQKEYLFLTEEPQPTNQQVYTTPTSVFSQNDRLGAVVHFVLGLFCFFPLPVCYVLYRKSNDELARVLAKISLVLMLITIGIIVITVVLSIFTTIVVLVITLLEQ